jgi:hypothetical protein
MTMIGIIFIAFALIVLLSPWIEAEDRPDFLRPNGKARAAVGSWFATVRQR